MQTKRKSAWGGHPMRFSKCYMFAGIQTILAGIVNHPCAVPLAALCGFLVGVQA
ncbi:CRISPR-associated protein Cse3 [Ralstonia solanacearum]|nr:CRISPR-associated protein Cse3 [Ralstonia solanacearum]